MPYPNLFNGYLGKFIKIAIWLGAYADCGQICQMLRDRDRRRSKARDSPKKMKRKTNISDTKYTEKERDRVREREHTLVYRLFIVIDFWHFIIELGSAKGKEMKRGASDSANEVQTRKTERGRDRGKWINNNKTKRKRKKDRKTNQKQ